jgi:hypothetical protein
MEDIENTAKKHERKRQAIQLPPALHRAVKLEINARFERGGGKVTQGDVLIEAWDAYMRHRVESPVSTDPSPVERGQKSGVSGIQCRMMRLQAQENNSPHSDFTVDNHAGIRYY